MILTQAQAEAVYSAMCALNNVGGRVEDLRIGYFGVSQNNRGKVRVRDYRHGSTDPRGFEHYDSQAAFAAVYGLQ